MNKNPLFQAAAKFFSGTILSRISGLVRDIAMAASFGTTGAIAAFLVAFRLSYLLRRLLGEGALHSSFIPYFEKLRQENPNLAYAFFRKTRLRLSLLLSILIALVMSACFTFHSLKILDPDNNEILLLTALMMPGLLFICLYGLNSAFLQCHGCYLTASCAPVAFNLAWTVGVLILAGSANPFAMRALALVIVAASFAQYSATIVKTSRYLPKTSCLDISLVFFYRPMLLAILGVGATQINSAFDALFARSADLNGPAYLWYAIRFQQLPLALFGIALSSALAPSLARSAKSSDGTSFHRYLHQAVGKTLLLMLPCTALLFLTGDRIIDLFYARGGFTPESTINSTLCLWGYAIGLAPMALTLQIAPAYFACENFRTPTISAFLSVIVNITLNSFFIYGLQWGAASVALATSFSAFLNAGILITYLKQKEGVEKGLKEGARYFACLACALVPTVLFFPPQTALDIARKTLPLYPATILAKATETLLPIIAFSLLFIPLAYWQHKKASCSK